MGDAGDMFKGVIVGCVALGIAVGFVLFVAIPWAWHFVKPFIHALTA